jgi:hypothetical protein
MSQPVASGSDSTAAAKAQKKKRRQCRPPASRSIWPSDPVGEGIRTMATAYARRDPPWWQYLLVLALLVISKIPWRTVAVVYGAWHCVK